MVVLWCFGQERKERNLKVAVSVSDLPHLTYWKRILNKFSGVKELQSKKSTTQIMPVLSKLPDLSCDWVLNPKFLRWNPNDPMLLLYSSSQPLRLYTSTGMWWALSSSTSLITVLDLYVGVLLCESLVLIMFCHWCGCIIKKFTQYCCVGWSCRCSCKKAMRRMLFTCF